MRILAKIYNMDILKVVYINMITNGEDVIKRVIAIDGDGKAIPPCGACREFMTRLMPENYRDIEIMMDYETGRVVTLGELTPEWWL